jgi:hypothetical protein
MDTRCLACLLGPPLAPTIWLRILAGTLSLMNTAWPPIFRHTGITLAGRKHFIFTTFNRSSLRCRAVAEPDVNLSHCRQFLLCQTQSPAPIFRQLELANRVLQVSADEVARNGAPLKINFGQRFSWTPLAFSLHSVSSGRRQTSPKAHRWPMNLFQPEFFQNVQSRSP